MITCLPSQCCWCIWLSIWSIAHVNDFVSASKNLFFTVSCMLHVDTVNANRYKLAYERGIWVCIYMHVQRTIIVLLHKSHVRILTGDYHVSEINWGSLNSTEALFSRLKQGCRTSKFVLLPNLSTFSACKGWKLQNGFIMITRVKLNGSPSCRVFAKFRKWVLYIFISLSTRNVHVQRYVCTIYTVAWALETCWPSNNI